MLIQGASDFPHRKPYPGYPEFERAKPKKRRRKYTRKAVLHVYWNYGEQRWWFALEPRRSVMITSRDYTRKRDAIRAARKIADKLGVEIIKIDEA
jgi:hypothetical protein